VEGRVAEEVNVLIIDDDSLVRQAFRRILERAGFVVWDADDGANGIARFRELSPSVVLLDLRMPGRDGLDVLSELVQEAPETPILVVSGAGTMTDVVEALRRGAWDFVTKPILDNELLVRGVWRGLEKAALIRQNREYAERLMAANQQLSDALDELRSDEQAARHLQFALLPEDGIKLGPCRCHRRLWPSRVLSGDFVDYFSLGDRCLGFYLADVSGHGAGAAFMTAILTTLVDKYRDEWLRLGDETILHPQQILSRLDRDLRQHCLEKHLTMFCGVCDFASRRLVYASAGAFPYPLLFNGQRVVELECAGRPLNLPGAHGFGHGEVVFEPGARLLLASDGVLELEPKQTPHERRNELMQLMHNASDAASVLNALAIAESTPLSDDVALLFLHWETA
jgi:phosphoserine phosphatase RsbU/P